MSNVHTAWKVLQYEPEENSVFVHFSRSDNFMTKINLFDIINAYNK